MTLPRNKLGWPRRSFLKTASLAGLLGIPWSRSQATAISMKSLEGKAPNWVRTVRRQIPATGQSLYFQHGGIGPSPDPVIEEVKRLLDLQNQGPADPRYVGTLAKAEDSCRALVAGALGCREEEVAPTHNTTEALNIVIWSIGWKEGDEILISNHEHPALRMPSYNLRDRLGVTHRRAPIDVGEDVVDNVLSLLSPRTRLVAMSHVSRRNGRVIPAQRLAQALQERSVRLLLDGAQGAGNVSVEFHKIGCDDYAFCGHKWLLGPKGTGGLMIRKEILETTPISWTGAHSHLSLDDEGQYEWHPNARRYEFGTRAQAVFGGFAEALRWLDNIGWEKIYQRISDLSGQAARIVKESKKFELVSPLDRESKSGVFVLRLPEGSSGRKVYDKLAEVDRILVSPLDKPRDLRVCLHFFNTLEEFETLMARLDQYC